MLGLKLPSWLRPAPDPSSTGPLLFSIGATDYERIKFVADGPHGEQVLLAWRHRPGYLPQRVVVKCTTREHPRPEWRRIMEGLGPTSRLMHPGIASILDTHEAGGVHYTVLEFIEGHSLAKVLGYAALRGRPLSEAFGLYACLQVAEALRYAHSFQHSPLHPWGLVHRDVSPSNLRLGRDGRVVLTNFDVAWSCLPDREAATEGAAPLGDLDYAAPERLCPELRHWRLVARMDLFSLGLVLLELLTGQHLYYVPPLDRRVLYARRLLDRLESRPPGAARRPVEELTLRAELFTSRDLELATRGLSAPVRSVLRKLLRQDPLERYPTAGQLYEDLRQCLRTQSRWYGAWRARREFARLEWDVAHLLRSEAKPPSSLIRPG